MATSTDWSPWPAGDGSPATHTFTKDSGVAYPLTGLSGSNLALHLLNINSQMLYICTGTWAIQGDGSAGIATFTPSAQDIGSSGAFGIPGIYKAYPVLQLASGPKPMDWQYVQVVSEP